MTNQYNERFVYASTLINNTYGRSFAGFSSRGTGGERFYFERVPFNGLLLRPSGR